MFIVASTDLKRSGGRHDAESAAKALRRVGADIVVLANCEHGSGSRIKRQARYGSIETLAGEPPVSVLAGAKLRKCSDRPDGVLLCEVEINNSSTKVAAPVKEPLELCRVLVSLRETDHLVIAGRFDVDLNEPETINTLLGQAALDTREPEHHGEIRDTGIVAVGLHVYGSGEYTNETGLLVRWARLGH